MQIRVDSRFYSVYLCTESIQRSFHTEVEVSSLLDLLGITFRYGEFHFQWSDFGQFGNHGSWRSIRTDTDLSKSDNSVKRSTKFSQFDIGFYNFYVGVQGS